MNFLISIPIYLMIVVITLLIGFGFETIWKSIYTLLAILYWLVIFPIGIFQSYINFSNRQTETEGDMDDKK